MNYQSATAQLTGRNSQRRKVGNNTYLERRGEDIAIRLHNTDIITFHQNGEITLNTGGWTTVTTKARMNEFLEGWYISQSKGQWYIGKRFEGNWADIALYADNCILQPDGTVLGAESLEAAKERVTLRKQVLKYSKDYIKAFKAGKVPAPNAGDCWGCLMVDMKTGKTAIGGDHIREHLREKYYVPSLLLRAVENFPVSQVAKWVIGSHWYGGEKFEGSMADIGYEQLRKALYRYCLRELGQAS